MKILKRFAPLFLAVVLVFGSCFSVNASALDEIAKPPTYYENEKHVYYCYDGRIWVWIFSADADIDIIADNSKFTVYTGGSGLWGGFVDDPTTSSNYDKYDAWTMNDYSNHSKLSGYYEYFLESDYNIYDSNGNLVFPPPPPNPVKAVEVLPEMIAPQIQTLMTIAVSSLVLLMGLVMLRKKLPIFLRS